MWNCPHCGEENEDTKSICTKCCKSPFDKIERPLEDNIPEWVIAAESHQEPQIKCPVCGSTQFTANKKGFSVGKALVGGALLGGVGLLGGFIGSGNIRITCLNCGYHWNV